jgi:hypothetical protein
MYIDVHNSHLDCQCQPVFASDTLRVTQVLYLPGTDTPGLNSELLLIKWKLSKNHPFKTMRGKQEREQEQCGQTLPHLYI